MHTAEYKTNILVILYHVLHGREGFHFVDIPFESIGSVKLPRLQYKAYLSDFDDPKRLIESDEDDTSSMLDNEPCAELLFNCKQVSAGGSSKYLPEVYRDLYEEGNIITF